VTDDERVETIRLLVPTAAGSATELDTVLSRLLLAARPPDEPTFQELEQLATMWSPPPQRAAAPATTP
jgi:hypothetical protein